jgi:hypothetical protein
MPARVNAGSNQAERFLDCLFAGQTKYTIEIPIESGAVDAELDPLYSPPTTFSIPMLEEEVDELRSFRSETGEETRMDAKFYISLADWTPIKTAIDLDLDAADPEIVTPSGRRYRMIGISSTIGQNGVITLYGQKHRTTR